VRRPLLFLAGLGIAFSLAVTTQPRWDGICANFNAERGIPCSPMTFAVMFGYFVIGLGIFTMILGPIINSLYRLYRYGQVWETSRAETAIGNVPLIMGLVYVVLGFVIAAVAG
jgi:hypothetical protein